jgi:hypothetical protein
MQYCKIQQTHGSSTMEKINKKTQLTVTNERQIKHKNDENDDKSQNAGLWMCR